MQPGLWKGKKVASVWVRSHSPCDTFRALLGRCMSRATTCPVSSPYAPATKKNFSGVWLPFARISAAAGL
jgi:hypothetical protein